MNIKEEFEKFCKNKNITYEESNNVKSYDDTTLFCPAGMQRYKSQFKDINVKGTVAGIQSCLRLNDLDEINDGTHSLCFDMLGLFSFREMTIKQAIDFWINFIEELKIEISYVTIHPDKKEWIDLYPLDIKVILDESCKWSDGEIGGYCTEFFHKDIEIGNIVNPLGNCIDCGFGLSRLDLIVNNNTKNGDEILLESVIKIIDSGFLPSGKLQGSILRKLIRLLWKNKIETTNEIIKKEYDRLNKNQLRYNNLINKHKDKSAEWWLDTHGIDID